jgi:hypothetical protein
MRNTDAIARDWRNWGLGRPFHREMTLTEAGLALGRGTLLSEFEKKGRAAGGLALDGNEARLLSLLTAAYRQPLAGRVIEKIRRAGEIWRAGDKSLAQIHLAFLGLPKIGEADAYRLFLAGTALEKGASPSDLLKALGFPRAARDLEKYNPDQPRVPAGSGRESGQWTSDGAGGANVSRPKHQIIMSDANPTGIVAGAQYAQASQTPVICPKTMTKILKVHGPGALAKYKGKGEFNAEFATPEGIRDLVDRAFAQATPDTVGPGDPNDSVVMFASRFSIDNATGVITRIPVGMSGRGLRVPSVETNTYVVILDSDNNVRTAYPINPADEINPMDPADQANE